jgi:hypothetical protein
MPLSLLEVTNVIEDTKLALLRSKEKLGGISGIIIFNCLHRILELEHNKLTGKYAKLFDDFPTIGFNSLAEQFIGNLNQTAVMILFK